MAHMALRGEKGKARHHRQYTKIQLYLNPSGEIVQNRWYEGEDIMDPREVASPIHRVESPNIDGSIGGDKGYPLPAGRPDWEYIHNNKEFFRRVTYSCT